MRNYAYSNILLLLVSLALLTCTSQYAHAQIITTIAGNGTSGYSGDGGPAIAAALYYPRGVATDRSRNVYIADAGNGRIRRVSPSGIISLLAGSGVRGYSGDGGAATAAQLNMPQGLATDSIGNIYIADNGNNRIRRIDTSGIMSTIAGTGTAGYSGDGGLAISAKLNQPTAVAIDRAGNLYICDCANSCIRKVSRSGIITTVAGNGTNGYSGDGGPATLAQLYFPNGVTTDDNGNIYIADTDNETIRKVTSPGIISTMAGRPGTTGTTGDGGPATAAEIYLPDCVVFRNGNLYIGLASSYSVRMIAASGIISTVAGSSTCCFSGDGGAATLARLATPLGLAFDNCDNMYIADAYNNRVRKITIANGTAISGPERLCAGTTITLSDTATGAIWRSSNTAVATVGAASGIVAGISPGTATITCSNGISCDATKIVTVDGLPEAGTIVAFIANTFCIGKKSIVRDTTAGGVWSLSNNHIALSGDTITAISAGVDTLFYTVTNACGSSAATDIFEIPPPLPALSGNLSICVGDTGTIADSTIWGGMWYVSNTNLYIQTTFYDSNLIIAGVSAGTSVITFSLDLGCSTTTVVTVNPLPDAGVITGPGPLCINTSRYLHDNIPGGTWHSASPVAGSIDTFTGLFNSISPGRDTITYTVPPNIYGCKNKAIFIVTVSPFTSSGNMTGIQCYGSDNGAIALTVNGGSQPLQYIWSTGGNSASAEGLTAGTYTVQVKDASGSCSLTDTFIINQPDSLQINTEIKSDKCHTGAGSIRIAASGGVTPYSYLWSNNAVTSSINGLTAATYSLLLTDNNGCIKKIIAEVPDSACTNIIVHDGISPNGDGINDTWIIEGLQDYPNNEVQVFDKWGARVFEEHNYKGGWNGKGTNGLLPDGTYYYLVKLNSPDAPDGKNNLTGTVLIKR